MPLTDKEYANSIRSMIIGFNNGHVYHTCTSKSTTYHLDVQICENYDEKERFEVMTITVNKPCSELRTCSQHSEDDPYHKWTAVKILKITLSKNLDTNSSKECTKEEYTAEEYTEELDHLDTPIIFWRNRLSPDTKPSYIRLYLLGFADDECARGHMWMALKNGPWREGDLGKSRAFYILGYPRNSKVIANDEFWNDEKMNDNSK